MSTPDTVTVDLPPVIAVITQHPDYARAVLDQLAIDRAVREATGDELFFTPAPVPLGMPADVADVVEAAILEAEGQARALMSGLLR